MTATKVKPLGTMTPAPCERGDEVEITTELRRITGTVLSVKWSSVTGWWVEASCEDGTWTGMAERVRKA